MEMRALTMLSLQNLSDSTVEVDASSIMFPEIGFKRLKIVFLFQITSHPCDEPKNQSLRSKSLNKSLLNCVNLFVYRVIEAAIEYLHRVISQ